jgi:hypothetical protein
MTPYYFRYFILILFQCFFTTHGQTFTNGCPNLCTCLYTSNVLVIKCSGPQNNFNFLLPDTTTQPSLATITSLVIKNSNLNQFPSNLCTYARTLLIIDMSFNIISQDITSSTFSCLTSLQFLNLSSNSIVNIQSNSFDSLNNLVVLDLSYNQITYIPPSLFYQKLPSLTTLWLKYNSLTELDIWFVFLKSINYLDLSYNKISKFVNTIGFSTNSNPQDQIMMAQIVDFRHNLITKFDDSVLALYSVCNINAFAYFLRLLQKMRIDTNPLDCSCSSYNMLSFYQTYITIPNNPLISDNIFLPKCATPSIYAGRSIYSFTSISTCSSSLSFNNVCPTTTRTTTTTTTQANGITLPQNVAINTPQLQLADDGSGVLKTISRSGAWIAGIVVGFFGALVLFLLLLYCICPVEILAVTFECIPFFYSCCPCKSGVKRTKEYDLFISYNETTEKWVRKVLIPFIQAEYLVENYILHYNADNRNQQVFNENVRMSMDKSTTLLLVLDDAYILKEWNNLDFRRHLRYLVTKERHRLICIQMHNVSDDDVEEYFRKSVQLPYFVALENDEFLFWKKLAYHLHMNSPGKDTVMPVYQMQAEKSIIQPRLKYIDSDRSSEDNLINKKRKLYNLYDLQQVQKTELKLRPPEYSSRIETETPTKIKPQMVDKDSKKMKKVKSKFLLDELPPSNLNTQLSIAYINDNNSYYSYDHHTHKVKVDHTKTDVVKKSLSQTSINEKQHKRRGSTGSNTSTNSKKQVLSSPSNKKRSLSRSSVKQTKLEYTQPNMSDDSSI